MNVKSVTKGDKSNEKLVIEIGKEQFQEALDKAYKQNRNDIYVAGFRKGKAPRKVVEGMYGKSVFYEDAVNILYPEVVSDAIKQAELKVVGTPSIEDLDVSDDGSLTLTMNFDVYPEITLGEYKGIEAYKPPVNVSDEDIQAEIDALLERNSRIVTVERAAEDGDTVVIDFEGFVDDEAFEGGKGESYSLKLGSGTFIPGFEEQLVGLSAGDEKDVVVSFPENYTEELAGKEATFKCKVHEVKAAEKPELDDEFAKDVSEFDTLDELRADLLNKKVETEEKQSQSVFESGVMEAIVKTMEAEIPDSMVETQLDNVIEQFGYQVQMAGMQMQDYLNMLGADMETLRLSYRPMALAQVQSELVLSKVSELENFELTDEDFENEYNRMVEQFNMELDKVKELVKQEDLAYDLKLQKAQKLIMDNAIATDVELQIDEATMKEIEDVVAAAVDATEPAGSEAEDA